MCCNVLIVVQSLAKGFNPINTQQQRASLSFGPRHEKTFLWGFANNTGADQPAHPRSLVSAFVIRFLESIISRLAMSEISIF